MTLWITANPGYFTMLALPCVLTVCTLVCGKFIAHVVSRAFKKLNES